MNTLKVIILLATLSSLLLIIGYFIARGTGVMIALILSVIMNFGSYWYSDSIVLSMYDARPVTRMEAPALYDAVESLSHKARIPVPKVYVIPQTSPNAFATGRDEDHAAVAVTSGILKILNKDELEGVIAHELSHIKHKDILISTMAATIASAVVLLSRWAMFFGGNEDSGMITTIAVAVIAPVAATHNPDGHIQIKRIRSGCRRGRSIGETGSIGRCSGKIGTIGREKTAGCKPRDGPYVYCQSLVRRGDHESFQHPPSA